MAVDTDADRIAEQLDNELQSLKDQVSSIRRKLKVECSTILSAPSTSRILKTTTAPSLDSIFLHLTHRPNLAPPTQLLDRAALQKAHMQQSLYRLVSPVTAFKVQDPDPNAVDGGHVLGLRFELMTRGQFMRSWYVQLNRPFGDKKSLRIHKHTFPPAIPLAGLQARYLPRPGGERKQDLDRFVRAVRREIARYQNRLGVSADLRRGLGLHERNRRDLKPNDVVEVGIADIDAKQIKLTWADDRSGRLVMDDDGRFVKLAVFGRQGRDWETTKELMGEYEHIDDVVKRIQEYAAT